ncbi:MAG: GMC family oxidoreductase [Pseudomonadota bacterium]
MRVDIDGLTFDRYEFLIAGSGLAAYALARRLSAAGRRALIFESGPSEFYADLHARFTGMYGRGHFDGSYWPTHWIRALGGSSAAWAGWVVPLSERNLRDWPIGRADLDPYLDYAMELLRRPRAAAHYTAPFIDGFTFRPVSIGAVLNLAFEPELLESMPGVDIAVGTTVCAVRPAADRRSIIGVSLHVTGQGVRDVALQPGQSVILAAGGMGNPQILLNSTDGESAAVGNETDQVGRYLMEHPTYHNCGRLVASADLRLPATPASFGDGIEAIEPDEAGYAALGGRHDVSLELSPSAISESDPVETFVAERLGEGAHAFAVTAKSDMLPDPENRVRIAEGRDPAGMLRLRAMCHVDAGAFRAVDRCLELLNDSLLASGRGRVRVLNRALVREVEGGGHTMGTTRMGTDPRTSVVDADCRVHGYRNLFVAGSSVFTTGGYANPTLNLMALAARLGDHLSGQA